MTLERMPLPLYDSFTIVYSMYVYWEFSLIQQNKFTGKLAVPQVPTASLLDIVSKNNKRVVYMDDSQQTSFHGRKANMADMINITKGKETICKTYWLQ